jgi:hypothetical protein
MLASQTATNNAGRALQRALTLSSLISQSDHGGTRLRQIFLRAFLVPWRQAKRCVKTTLHLDRASRRRAECDQSKTTPRHCGFDEVHRVTKTREYVKWLTA